MKEVVGKRFNIPPDAVDVHTTLAGGGFGRRWYPDIGVQIAAIAKEVRAPVKVLWSRPEDTQHDLYRPPAVARFRAALSRSGVVTGVHVRQARLAKFRVEKRYQDLPYRWPAFIADFTERPCTVSYGAWRSTEDAPQAFFVESFVDELAHALAVDPIEYRKSLLPDDKRSHRVLDALRERSGWNSASRAGTGRGVALWHANGSLAAQVAEVSLTDGRLKVDRVICVFDCGTAVNPDSVRAQGEGSIIYGLTAALYSRISMVNGKVGQSNFDTMPVVLLRNCPEILIEILDSPDSPIGGAGEPMTGPIAPAVANAIFALTGKRPRRLPFAAAGFDFVS